MFAIDPVINDPRTAMLAADPSRTVVFHEPLSWANGPDHRATHAVLLPAGVYTLEAENEEFSYFKAPSPLSMGTFEAGSRTGGYDFDGGVAFAKSRLAQIPAEAYVSRSQTDKIHVMRLGYDFYQLQGKVWEKVDE
jgi:hypothetical protein